MIEVIYEFFRTWPEVAYALGGIPLLIGCALFNVFTGRSRSRSGSPSA